MQGKKKIFGIIATTSDYDLLLNVNLDIYKQIFKEYGNFYILNLSNFIISKKKITSVKKKNIFSKRVKIFKPQNKTELINFFKNKTFIAFNNLSKDFINFRIYYYLNKIDIKQILLMNYGHKASTYTFLEKNERIFSNIKNKIYFIKRKSSYLIFRILTILYVFPKIEHYFEASKDVVDSINNKRGIIKKIEGFFPFLKISYFRNTYKINSRAFDSFKINKKISSKFICFVDSGIKNADISLRGEEIDLKQRKKYYTHLKSLFAYLTKIYNKKIIICLHPKNSDKYIYKNFKEFKILKYRTSEIIKDSYIILFHDSSAVLDAILMKKKIICIKSNILGNFWGQRIDWYTDILSLPSIELNKRYSINKSKLLKKFTLSRIKQKKYILKNLQIDKNKTGSRKIIDVINKIYFNKK